MTAVGAGICVGDSRRSSIRILEKSKSGRIMLWDYNLVQFSRFHGIFGWLGPNLAVTKFGFQHKELMLVRNSRFSRYRGRSHHTRAQGSKIQPGLPDHDTTVLTTCISNSMSAVPSSSTQQSACKSISFVRKHAAPHDMKHNPRRNPNRQQFFVPSTEVPIRDTFTTASFRLSRTNHPSVTFFFG